MIEDISKMDLSGFMIAEVRDNIDLDNEGKIKVFIPQIMYENEYNEKPYDGNFDVELDNELILNAKDFQNVNLELEESNYMIARPLSYYEDNDPNWKYQKKYYNAGSLRIPRIGAHVIVIFFNSDLQKCYYLPFSPNVEKDKISTFNCINPLNMINPNKRPNVDVIRFYWDGMRIEADTNDHIIKLSTSEGNYIKLSNDDIEIKGNVHLLDELQVDKKALFKNTVTIDQLVTCKENLVVQGTSFIYNGERVNGSLINNKINLTTHIHSVPLYGNTSQPSN